MRKLASIRKIDAIQPIENADAIEVATVGGWKVVVKKNEFTVGELAVYFEIDSWIPHAIAPFLSKGKEPREFEGVKGERLRTVKLRGQISQGLLMPVQDDFTGTYLMIYNDEGGEYALTVSEGDDVTEKLGILKWEMEIPTQLAGLVKGNFPTAIPKTDQERVQNIVLEINQSQGKFFEVTEKLEGTSMTCYMLDNEFGVCGRNLDLKMDDKNSLWATAIREDIENKLRKFEKNNIALQGELVGPGIQGNIYNLPQLEFFIFDVYDVNKGCYFNPIDRQNLIMEIGLKHVPVLENNFQLIHTVDELILKSDGKSIIGNKFQPLREGIVFKEMVGEMSFKAISNKYLLGQTN